MLAAASRRVTLASSVVAAALLLAEGAAGIATSIAAASLSGFAAASSQLLQERAPQAAVNVMTASAPRLTVRLYQGFAEAGATMRTAAAGSRTRMVNDSVRYSSTSCFVWYV